MDESDNSPYSLRPLPLVLRHGLAAVATMGSISFVTSLGLLVFLTYKLVQWNNGTTEEITDKDTVDIAVVESPSPSPSPVVPMDAAFVIPNEWVAAAATVSSSSAAAAQVQKPETRKKESWIQRAINEPPNQFLVLIFNLLLADIQQALAFLLNIKWLTRNAIEVGTGTCWTQGWFVSTGDLASSVFITGIAVHTYMSVVRVKKLPSWAFHTAIVMMWGFVYGTGVLGVIVTENGKNDGGLYVRAGAWCWINSKYQDLRMTLHYLWIFISLILTTGIYFTVFMHLQKMARSNRGVVDVSAPYCNTTTPEPESIHLRVVESSLLSTCSGSSTCVGSDLGTASYFASHHSCTSDPSIGTHPITMMRIQKQQKQKWLRTVCFTTILRRLPGIPDYARQHTFLLYPLVYVVCTFPLAAGRLASMAGHEVSLVYYCFAGAMIASNGWLDVVLYSSTRRSIVFAAEKPRSDETGLETFAFMCPAPPKFGNNTVVTGGVDRPRHTVCGKWNEKMNLIRPKSGCVTRLRDDRGSSASPDGSSSGGGGRASNSGNSMRGGSGAIQCETVTTVSVELNTEPQITRPGMAALARKPSDASCVSSTSQSTSIRSRGDY